MNKRIKLFILDILVGCRTGLVFVVVLLCYYTVNSQCPTTSLAYDRQSQVDSFNILYPGCDSLQFSMRLKFGIDDPINNLSPLHEVTFFSRLSIERCRSLRSLDGLQNVTGIESFTIEFTPIATLDSLVSLIHISTLNLEDADEIENLDILDDVTELRHLKLVSNNTLSDISGLSGVTTLSTLDLEENNELKTLEGLEHTKRLTRLRVYNTGLISFKGLDSLESIDMDQDVEFLFNSDLESFDGLQQLKTIGNSNSDGRRLTIRNSHKISSFNGLNGLNRILMGFVVHDCSGLVNFEGLENLRLIKGGISIYNNNLLRSFQALVGVEISGDYLDFHKNRSLNDCVIPTICDYLGSSKDRVVHTNSGICSSDTDILAQCMVSVINKPEVNGVLQVSPNPAESSVNIILKSPQNFFRLYNFMGNCVKSGTLETLSTGEYYLDLAILPIGTYMLLISDHEPIQIAIHR